MKFLRGSLISLLAAGMLTTSSAFAGESRNGGVDDSGLNSPQGPTETGALSSEDREVIKMMDLLLLMEMLQDLDVIDSMEEEK